MELDSKTQIASLNFEKGTGLIPVIAQEAHTGEVLMLAYANGTALERSLESGQMWYFSRSRNKLWRKGESSGNTQRLVSLHADCDGDTVLARVKTSGPACHTGAPNCFGIAPTLAELAQVLATRRGESPEKSYTARLLSDRNLRLKKLGEEALELALACADDDKARIAEEAADIAYHMLVACMAADVSPEQVLASLDKRLPANANVSGGTRSDKR